MDMRNVFSPESWLGGHYANGLVSSSWSRSDLVMVAVGFQPTVGVRKGNRRRVATHETAGFQMVPTRSGRRAATPYSYHSQSPWVKTHGYLQWSLRDRKNAGFSFEPSKPSIEDSAYGARPAGLGIHKFFSYSARSEPRKLVRWSLCQWLGSNLLVAERPCDGSRGFQPHGWCQKRKPASRRDA